MLDDLREQGSFQEEEPLKPPKKSKPPKAPKAPRERKPAAGLDKITHMTAGQRFAVSIMFLIIVILLGAMFLVISGKVVPILVY